MGVREPFIKNPPVKDRYDFMMIFIGHTLLRGWGSDNYIEKCQRFYPIKQQNPLTGTPLQQGERTTLRRGRRRRSDGVVVTDGLSYTFLFAVDIKVGVALFDTSRDRLKRIQQLDLPKLLSHVVEEHCVGKWNTSQRCPHLRGDFFRGLRSSSLDGEKHFSASAGFAV